MGGENKGVAGVNGGVNGAKELMLHIWCGY